MVGLGPPWTVVLSPAGLPGAPPLMMMRPFPPVGRLALGPIPPVGSLALGHSAPLGTALLAPALLKALTPLFLTGLMVALRVMGLLVPWMPLLPARQMVIEHHSVPCCPPWCWCLASL